MQFIQDFFNLFSSSESKEHLDDNDENNITDQNIEMKNNIRYMLLNTKNIDNDNNHIIVHVTDTNGEFQISYFEENIQYIVDINSNNIENNENIYNILYNQQKLETNNVALLEYRSNTSDVYFTIEIEDNACYLTNAPGSEDIHAKGSIETDCQNITFVALDNNLADTVHIINIVTI